MGKVNMYERLFDVITHSARTPEKDYIIKTKKGNTTVPAKKVQAFIKKQMHDLVVSSYSVTEDGKKAIQAFTGSTDLVEIQTNVWNAFQEVPNYDMGWQRAFRTVPLRAGQLKWTIGNVTSGVAMEILAEGQKVKYGSIEGTSVTVEVELYGTGLMLTWKTIEGRDLARFYSDVSDFRAKRMSGYADAHYGLLAAASLSNAVAWVAGTTDLQRDIATLNEGYNTIGENTKDSGYGDTANAKMLLYCAPRLKARVLQALRATSTDLIRSGGEATPIITANIEPIFTYNSNIPANKGILVLPGNKIQNSIYMQDKSFSRQDPDTLNMLKSSFDAFGGAVGDVDQTAELSFA